MNIKSIESFGTSAYKINGRAHHFDRVTTLRQVRPGHFEGATNGTTFKIEGGRPAGGTSREWFLDWAPVGNGFPCTSLVGALKIIETT